MYKWFRKLVLKPMQKNAMGEPYQPFGPEFGLTILPDYLLGPDVHKIRKQYIDTFMRQDKDAQISDGRLQLPPLDPDCFREVVDRLYEDKLVLPGHLNNQTVNFYDEGSFIRAHVDNMFIYDDTFAVMSIGSPGILRFVHVQNGEELECIIPENSVYIMEGPSRYAYFHYMPPAELKRVSIVLRRSIFRTTGCFAPVDQRLNSMLAYKAHEVNSTLLFKEIGVPRVVVEDEWMERQNLGPFDTSEMVKRLKPLRDWSLKQQLAEDRARYDELRAKGYLDLDLSWRFDELGDYFKQIEDEMTVNREALDDAAKQMEKMKAAASCGHHHH